VDNPVAVPDLQHLAQPDHLHVWNEDTLQVVQDGEPPWFAVWPGNAFHDDHHIRQASIRDTTKSSESLNSPQILRCFVTGSPAGPGKSPSRTM